MIEATPDSLATRVGKLERENRIWRRSLAAALLLFTGVVLMGQARSRALDAESFLLRDQNGKPRAAWQTGADGSPSLALFDDKGTTRLGFALLAGSPVLTFADQEARSRIVLGQSEDGILTLAFRGSGDKILRAGLSANPDGSAAFALYDKEGKARLGLEVQPDGSSDIVVMNRAGKITWKAP